MEERDTFARASWNDVPHQTDDQSDGVKNLFGRLDRLTSPQTVTFEVDPVGVMNDTIKNRITDRRISDDIESITAAAK
jgi:hypothetical protein